MKKRKIEESLSDPTLPRNPVVVGGKTYNLCFDLGALGEAETEINAELERSGSRERVNLLAALPSMNLASVRICFGAAVRKFQPELGFDEARRLLGLSDMLPVAMAIAEAFNASKAPGEVSADPQQPGE